MRRGLSAAALALTIALGIGAVPAAQATTVDYATANCIKGVQGPSKAAETIKRLQTGHATEADLAIFRRCGGSAAATAAARKRAAFIAQIRNELPGVRTTSDDVLFAWGQHTCRLLDNGRSPDEALDDAIDREWTVHEAVALLFISVETLCPGHEDYISNWVDTFAPTSTPTPTAKPTSAATPAR